MKSSKKSNKTTNQKGRKTRGSEEGSPMITLVTICLRSLLISISAALLIIFITSFVIIKTDDPCSAIIPASLIALYFSATLNGFIANKNENHSALLRSVSSSVTFILFILMFSIIIPFSNSITFSPGLRAMLFILTIPANMIGAFLGGIKIIKKRKSPYSRRR